MLFQNRVHVFQVNNRRGNKRSTQECTPWLHFCV